MFSKLRRILFLTVCMTITVLSFTGCDFNNSKQAGTDNKLNIAVTIYPICDFVQKVGGDKVSVMQLIPAGVEPHDWEPKPQDIGQLRTAKVLFYNGVGLEPISNILAPDVIKDVKAINLSEGISLLESGEKGAHHEHEKKEEQGHSYDPHIWLNPQNAVHEVEKIKEVLCTADPANTSYYTDNAARYIKELQALDSEYKSKLQNVKRRTFVTSHAAFAYLANRYDLTQLAVMGISPEEEPTAEHMKEIVGVCQSNDIKYIFTETLLNPKLSETIAKEVGAKTLVLNPIESLTQEELKKGEDYIKVMQSNLANLLTALNS